MLPGRDASSIFALFSMTDDNSPKDWLAWLLFSVLALTWGSSFILMKFGLESFSFAQLGMLRIAIAFWFTLLIAFRHLRLLAKRDVVPLVAVGLLGNAIPYLLFPLAVSHLPSGLVGILNSMVPLFTLIIGIIWFKTRVGLPSIIGIVLGFAGAVWLLVPGLDVNTTTLVYGMYPVLATVCYAISINVISSRLKHLGSLPITLLSLLFVGVPATIYVFTTDFVSIMQTDPRAWINLGYVALLGVFGTSLAVLLFNVLIKRSGPLFSASVTYAIPLVALLWGLADGEDLGWEHVIGMGAILAGVYIVNARRKKRMEMALAAQKKNPSPATADKGF